MRIKDETTDPKVSVEVRELIRGICEKLNQEELESKTPFMMIESFEVKKENE